MNCPIDAIGNPLIVGDRVVATIPHYKGLYKATITCLHPKTADIQLDVPSGFVRAARQAYQNMVKIPH